MSSDNRRFLPVAKPSIGKIERDFVQDAVDSGWVSSVGPYVTRFEQEFAAYVGTGHAVSISNGTDSIFITLSALGIAPGDEIIVPALTFVAVASAVVRTGAEPCFVDVNCDTWCIDPVAVERAISKRTRAIIAVHSYGHPADVRKLRQIADENRLPLIEDCAEAHGARVGESVVGSIGNAGCFSFYGNKIITTGEGGIITTDDPKLAARCRYLKDHAMDPGRPYMHSEVGYNCRMTNLQAALGCAQLQQIDEFLEVRSRLLGWYRKFLNGHDWIELNRQCSWAEPVVWMVCANFPGKSGQWTIRLMKFLKDAGIDSRPFFYPLCDLPPYEGYRTVGRDSTDVPVSRGLGGSGINLPTSMDMTERDVERVVSSLIEFVEGNAEGNY